MNAKTEADCLQRWLCAFGTTAAIVAATGCANVGSHPVETEPERPRFVPSAAAAAQIAKVAFADPETDPRSGAGYSREELFALHQELRALAQRNYRRAPSAREKEILRCILHGKPGRRIDTRPIVDKMMKKRDEEEKVSLFYDGYSVNWNMYHYRATGDRGYLDCAMVMADFIMADYDSRKQDPEAYATWAKGHCWLGLGRGYGGIAEMVLVIARDPALHDLKGVQHAGLTDDLRGLTYLERAGRWVADLKRLIDFRKANDRYDNGKWSASDKEVNYKGGPAATNRYLYYTHFLIAAAAAAEAVDAKEYGAWSAGLRETVEEVMSYFQRTFQRPEELREARRRNMNWSEEHQAFMSEYGPYVAWAYKPERDNTEDYIHLLMDMEAFDDIFRHNNRLLPDDVMRKIAVMLMTCTYNYETGGIPFNLDPKDPGRDPKTQQPWHTFYAPKYGKYIGRYLCDAAYDKFMARQFKVWDEQLLAGKLGRFSQYSMPQEIIEARLYRHDSEARFPRER